MTTSYESFIQHSSRQTSSSRLDNNVTLFDTHPLLTTISIPLLTFQIYDVKWLKLTFSSHYFFFFTLPYKSIKTTIHVSKYSLFTSFLAAQNTLIYFPKPHKNLVDEQRKLFHKAARWRCFVYYSPLLFGKLITV